MAGKSARRVDFVLLRNALALLAFPGILCFPCVLPTTSERANTGSRFYRERFPVSSAPRPRPHPWQHTADLVGDDTHAYGVDDNNHEHVPSHDAEVILPDVIVRNQLYNITMAPDSILVIKTMKNMRHMLHPKTLFHDVYLPNNNMSDCDTSRVVSWEEIFPLVPVRFGFWNTVKHAYVFRFPGKAYLPRRFNYHFCFKVEDKLTYKTTTILLNVSNAWRAIHAFTAAGTVFISVLSLTGIL